jgi:hypothetical protein
MNICQRQGVLTIETMFALKLTISFSTALSDYLLKDMES